MITVNNQLNFDTLSIDTLSVPKEKLVFFDIETTGFSAKNTSIYLIGVVYYQNLTWNLTQWFANDSQSEPLIISAFFEFIKPFDTLVHFNGEGFDIPYIKNKCVKYNLPYSFDRFNSIDIFKKTRDFQKLLKLNNYKQKTIETFLGIMRNDKYSGGELINIYHQYLHTNDNTLLSLLLLHNNEDLGGMLQVLPILSYAPVSQGLYQMDTLEISQAKEWDGFSIQEAIFTAVLDTPVPKRVSFGTETAYMTAYNTVIKLKVKIYTEELKYFYSNYNDYYYLPDEDTSIHKSVAFYVDKTYRTKAKAANCYSKKTGRFLPQYAEIISPYFKIDYYDKVLYFELEEHFLSDKNLQHTYMMHVISHILKKA